ncbi:MAG: hypothetical protein WKG01_09485 [Kofleriaceae bacterium]
MAALERIVKEGHRGARCDSERGDVPAGTSGERTSQQLRPPLPLGQTASGLSGQLPPAEDDEIADVDVRVAAIAPDELAPGSRAVGDVDDAIEGDSGEISGGDIAGTNVPAGPSGRAMSGTASRNMGLPSGTYARPTHTESAGMAQRFNRADALVAIAQEVLRAPGPRGRLPSWS